MSTKQLRRKKRTVRQNSNVFAIFDQKQITEFKEAFGTFDHNKDGFIDFDDLRDMINSLGMEVSDSYIEDMIREAPGPINFTMFLTLMGEHLNGTDPETEILAAFQTFDDQKNGLISVDDMKEALMTTGERFTYDEVEFMFKDAPVDANGYLNYKKFVQMLKHGE
ncbi:hypothetical protein H4219_002417 [Mycoemilia scoparia]|uniref:EF-hand domain-containing protein n=1 Tax=Mycoemilia scoparia TaxID=417184 RepID=A0A9W8DUD6_9FUNG|nr:hypothetical protein H4219_002417 [Mycoemilia scoparia]